MIRCCFKQRRWEYLLRYRGPRKRTRPSFCCKKRATWISRRAAHPATQRFWNGAQASQAWGPENPQCPPRGALPHPFRWPPASGVLAGAGLRPGPPRVLMHQWGGRGLLHELVLQVCEHGLGGGLSARSASGLHPALSRTPGLGAKGWRERIHPQSPPEIRTHTEGKATGCPPAPQFSAAQSHRCSHDCS